MPRSRSCFVAESCQTGIENANCYPTTTNVDMYYVGSETSEFRQRLLNALYLADLATLLAPAGVLEVGTGTAVDGGSDDDDGGSVVGQRAAEGLGGGAIAGIALAGIATVMVLLFLFVARKRSSESKDGQVKHIYMDEADDFDGTYTPHSARIVGEDSSHSSGWSGYTPERSANGNHILQDLNDFEDDHHCMGVELGLDGKARDVRRCASATCETCRQKRLRPMFIKGGTPPEPPPRLPLDARRVYAANDTVDF